MPPGDDGAHRAVGGFLEPFTGVAYSRRVED